MNGTHHGAGDNPRMTTESSMSDHDVEAIAASLPVRDGDEPWTADEISEIVGTLESDVQRMGTALAKAENDLADLMKQGNDGAGMDTIDVGSSQFERPEPCGQPHSQPHGRRARHPQEQAQPSGRQPERPQHWW